MSQGFNENMPDRKDLKIQALLEKLSEQESRIADLRVEITLAEQRINELESHQPQDNRPQEFQPMPEPQYIQGEVLNNVPQAPVQ